MIVAWIARRVEILMVAGVTFNVILFVLAVVAADGPRIIAYPVLTAGFIAIRYGARAVRQRTAGERQENPSVRVSSEEQSVSTPGRPPKRGRKSNLGDLRRESMTDNLTRLLDDLTSLGFELWVEGDDLVVEGESVIDAGLADAIRANKPELIALFTRPPANDTSASS